MKKSIEIILILLLTVMVTKAGTYSGGDGSSGNPFIIATTDDLIELSKTANSGDWDKYFRQTADIIFNEDETLVDWDGDGILEHPGDDEVGFYPIGKGSSNFTGVYDGDGHTIVNLFINRVLDSNIGLFTSAVGSSEIMNLGIVNGNITGYSTVGMLLGISNATISNCFTTGSVTCTDYVAGGLIGLPTNGAVIINSYSTASVNGGFDIGGLFGDGPFPTTYTVTNCYSAGAVNGTGGGLVPAGNGATFNNCFWDTETSGKGSSGGGEGKTTAEMKDFNTFTDQTTVGLTTAWDFVSNPNDDAANDDDWDMDQDWSVNNGYPILSWQSESDNTLAFGGGLGTSGSPFQIDDLTDIMILSLSEQYWDAYFIQTADIDATATQYWDDSDDDSDGHPYNDANDLTLTGNGEGFLPVAASTGFEGVYDGDGHTIVNLYINRPSEDKVGFIGVLSGGKEIKNLGIVNGNITGDTYVGLLAGIGNGKISNCYSTGSVSATGNVVGGLVGRSLIAISSNFAMTNCYSTASVTGNSTVGGLIGELFSSGFEPVAIENNYSTGAVSGNSSVGGLVGSISNVTVSNSFWDKETSGKTTSAGGTGKTTAEMKELNTFTDAGWDFVVETTNGTDNYWDMDQEETVNNGYPILSWQDGVDNILKYSSGSGTSGDPWQIATTDDLIELSNSSADWDSYFIQTADITFDANEQNVDWDGDGSATWDTEDQLGFSPIGISPDHFTGNYDGDGHTIVNLFINRPSEDRVGFIGSFSNSSREIINLGIVNGDITGRRYVGLLVGYGAGPISNSYSTGSVSASQDFAGGLVGYLPTLNGTFNDCYSTASVSGDLGVGGLAGHIGPPVNQPLIIDNCYSTGAVSGNSDVGGLFGRRSAYTTITNCFWDTETSGQGSSAGGSPKSTADMKKLSTFTGWNFDTVWDMVGQNGENYPNLQWESEITADNIGANFAKSDARDIAFQAESGTISVTFSYVDSTSGLVPAGARTIEAYWDISNLTGNAKIRLYYDPDDPKSTKNFEGNPVIYHYDGSVWEALPTEEKQLGTIYYLETINFYSSYSPVTIGDDAAPLPVELTYFEGFNTEDGVVLNWETATETNNYGFQVQRKKDKVESESEWEDLGFVQGHGTTNSPKHYEFTDSELPNADEVKYRLKQIDNDGTFAYSKTVTVDLTTITSVEDEQMPIVYSLEQNYPNPFNPSTTIKFGLPERGVVDLRVYNILGEEVARLVNKELNAGYHEVSFGNNNLASGMYIYRINVGGKFSSVKKMILMK